MDVKTLPLYIAVFISGLLAFANASVIFTGGVGKNGSTVAVSRRYKHTHTHTDTGTRTHIHRHTLTHTHIHIHADTQFCSPKYNN